MIMKTPPRNGREALVGPWLFFRYMVIGVYVGVATVFGYAWWFMFYEGGPQITWHQLVSGRSRRESSRMNMTSERDDLADQLPPVFQQVPRDWLSNVLQRRFQDCDHHVSVHPRR